MEKKPVRYEKPILEELDAIGKGDGGACSGGSVAAGGCGNGGTPAGACSSGGILGG